MMKSTTDLLTWFLSRMTLKNIWAECISEWGFQCSGWGHAKSMSLARVKNCHFAMTNEPFIRGEGVWNFHISVWHTFCMAPYYSFLFSRLISYNPPLKITPQPIFFLMYLLFGTIFLRVYKTYKLQREFSTQMTIFMPEQLLTLKYISTTILS